MEIFENGDSSYSCGRAKTEVFKYDDVMPRLKARSSAHTIRKRYVWTHIFLSTKKKSPFSKIPGYVWMVTENDIKNATCGRRSFLNTEEKISYFRKYPATCGRGLNE